MKKKVFYFLFICSVLLNIFYCVHLYDQKIHEEEFFSLFNVKNISYENGFLDFKEKINSLKKNKSFHLIHIWDTLGLEFNTKIPYIIQLDNYFKATKLKQTNCILMSSMSDQTIKTCLDSRGLNLNSLIIMNDMENYISGVCIRQGRKSKPSAATILINKKGDIIYYNDKIKFDIYNDTTLLAKLDSIE